MTRLFILVVFFLTALASPAQETARNTVAPSRPPPPPLTECKATPITIELWHSGHGPRESWAVTCTITYADETWFDARIPLPLGATRKEALKAIDNFMGHRAHEILKAHGWVVPKKAS